MTPRTRRAVVGAAVLFGAAPLSVSLAQVAAAPRPQPPAAPAQEKIHGSTCFL